MTELTPVNTRRDAGESALFYLVRDIFKCPVRDFYSDDPISFVDSFLFLANCDYWFELGWLNRAYFWKLLLRGDE